MQPEAEGQLRAQRPVTGQDPGERRLAGRPFPREGLQKLKEELQRLGAREREAPLVCRALTQRPMQMAREEVLLERRVGESEGTFLRAHDEGGCAQVLL